MNDLNFIKCLDELKLIHEKKPGLRLGEVLQGSADIIGRKNTNFFDISSKELLQRLKEYNGRLK